MTVVIGGGGGGGGGEQILHFPGTVFVTIVAALFQEMDSHCVPQAALGVWL